MQKCYDLVGLAVCLGSVLPFGRCARRTSSGVVDARGRRCVCAFGPGWRVLAPRCCLLDLLRRRRCMRRVGPRCLGLEGGSIAFLLLARLAPAPVMHAWRSTCLRILRSLWCFLMHVS